MIRPRYRKLEDWQWREVAHHLPRRKPAPRRKRDRKGGRPRASDRACFDALIWLVFNDESWKDLPHDMPSQRTLRRRLRQWRGLLEYMWRAYLRTCRNYKDLAAVLKSPGSYWRWTLFYALPDYWEDPMAAMLRQAARERARMFEPPTEDAS